MQPIQTVRLALIASHCQQRIQPQPIMIIEKQRDAEASTSALEREIDELVYALYGLTPEEKALVQAADF
jgi:hypothetical protein